MNHPVYKVLKTTTDFWHKNKATYFKSAFLHSSFELNEYSKLLTRRKSLFQVVGTYVLILLRMRSGYEGLRHCSN